MATTKQHLGGAGVHLAHPEKMHARTHTDRPADERIEWLLGELRHAPRGLPRKHLRQAYYARWRVSRNTASSDWAAFLGDPHVQETQHNGLSWLTIARRSKA